MSIEVEGLRKSFGGATALAGVDLTIAPGEVHALVGPNGAGKSTLIRCIAGSVRPDAGTIRIDGREHAGLSPKQALDEGVAAIYQNLSLIGTLTVAENIHLGHEARRGPFVSRRAQERRARQLLEPFDPSIRVDVPVERLPLAARQVVEIAKALSRGNVRLLILDEPTAALTEVEAEALAQRLDVLREQRIHVLYVTHLLKEVFRVADRVTALRDGRVVLSAPVPATDHAMLIRAIAGRSLVGRDATVGPAAGPVVLSVRSARGDGFGPITLELREGEIVGLFGLRGSGKVELLEAIAGGRPTRAGDTLLDGRSLGRSGPDRRIAAGIALVPGDRIRQGIFAPMSSLDNVLLPALARVSRGGFRRRDVERSLFLRLVAALSLRPGTPDLPARQLSGGNQQKAVVGRWLGATGRVRVLLLGEPTQGIDVGARDELYALVRRQARDERRAVLMASSDPAEVALLCDRALVLDRGRAIGQLSGVELDEERLLAMAHRTEHADAA